MNPCERGNRRRGYCGRVSAWSSCEQQDDCHQYLMESYRLYVHVANLLHGIKIESATISDDRC
ncbi:MAG: hypothetical protein ACFWUC_10430 [Oscillospiraceae bacterium]|jgi:hypothetical protein